MVGSEYQAAGGSDGAAIVTVTDTANFVKTELVDHVLLTRFNLPSA